MSDDSDSVSETTSTSWFGRLGQAFGGIVFGIILVIAACIGLFWNEGNAVKTARSLQEGAGLVQAVSTDKVDAANEGKLIYISGPLSTEGPASDGEFAMKSKGLRLVREVQMYQWKQETEEQSKKNLGGGETTTRTYKYSKEWSAVPVNSGEFHTPKGHENPRMTWRSRDTLAPRIKLGAFAVPDGLMSAFGGEKPLAAGDEQVQAVKTRTEKAVQVVDGVIYVGNPDQPAVGDYKISFREVEQQPASIVARQAGSGLGAYAAKAGRTVELIKAGIVPAAQLFQQAQDENRMITWIIRLVGSVAMFIGFALILRPLSVLADVLPFLGDIVGAGVGVVALLCTVVLAPIMIAIGWFTYRPLVAVIVLVAGGALSFGVVHLLRRRKAQKTGAAAAPA